MSDFRILTDAMNKSAAAAAPKYDSPAMVRFAQNCYTFQKSMEKLNSTVGTGDANVDDEFIKSLSVIKNITEVAGGSNARQRVVHTLKRMKEKGLYENMPHAVVRHPYKAKDQDERSVVVMSYAEALLEWGGRVNIWDTPISDEDWYRAIELAMIINKPDVFSHPETTSYAPFVEDYFNEIRVYAVILHAISVLESTSFGGFSQDELRQSINGVLKENEALTRQLEISDKQASEKDAEYRAKINEANLAHSKEMLRLQHECDDALSEKNKEIERLKCELQRLSGTKPVAESAVEAEAAPESTGDNTEAVEIELPGKNVLFLGGHNNLLSKVAATHPGWTLINDDGYGTKPGPGINLVFFWTNHISHQLEKEIFSKLDPNVNLVYVKSTNIDRLESEMKAGYAEMLKKNSSGKAAV